MDPLNSFVKQILTQSNHSYFDRGQCMSQNEN